MRTKQFFSIVLGLIFFVVCGNTTLLALKLDIKTKMLDKIELTPLVIATSFYLSEMGIELVNVGEQYAVWLEGIQRTARGDITTVQLTVKLTKPSMLRQGPTLQSTTIVFNYNTKKVEAGGLDASDESAGAVELFKKYTKYFKQQEASATQLMILEGMAGGKVIANAISSMLNKL